MSDVLLPLGAYLVGSIPFSFVVVRLLRGVDVRRVGSGNAGATNALRAAGLAPALAVLVLDIGKGVVPVMLARAWGATPTVLGTVAVAAVLGHLFPIYIGFRGGKGVATALGAFGGLALWPTMTAAAAILTMILWKRYVSLGSIVGIALVPLLMLGWQRPLWEVGVAAAIAVLVVARHSSNIQRLRSGTERRLGERVGVAR